MKMTPEGRIKARLRKMLNECPVRIYLFMPVQNGMGDATLDFIGCINGRFFAVETKAGHGVMTPRQVHTAGRMKVTGAAVFLLNEDPVKWQVFEDWLLRQTAIAALEQKELTTPQLPQWAADILNEGESNGSRSES